MANISLDIWMVIGELGPGVSVRADLRIDNTNLPNIEPTDEQMQPVINALRNLLTELMPGQDIKAQRIRPPMPETIDL